MQGPITVATHSGEFHADEVTALAILELYFARKGQAISVIRTRDKETYSSADMVVDVGTVYDEKTHRYDHHQLSFTEKRPNGIPYASAGLIWRHFGLNLCDGDSAVHEKIDSILIATIDAGDSAVVITTPKKEDFPSDYSISKCISRCNPAYGESIEGEYADGQFKIATMLMRNVLSREILNQKARIAGYNRLMEVYSQTVDHSIMVLPEFLPYKEFSAEHEDIQFFVSEHTNGNWIVTGAPMMGEEFKRRRYLPVAWSGLRDAELQSVSGIPDAIFCHKDRFIFGAQSKESAIRAAQLGIEEGSVQ